MTRACLALATVLLIPASAARAERAVVAVSAGGGLGQITGPACLDGVDERCGPGDQGTARAGALSLSLHGTSPGGLRAGARAQGMLVGASGAAQVALLGLIGLAGDRLVAEVGLGGGLMWLRDDGGGAERAIALQASAGARITRGLSLLARADLARTDSAGAGAVLLVAEWAFAPPR